MKSVRIVMTGHGLGRVWFDDMEVTNVVHVDFSAGIHEVNRVTVEISAERVEVETPIEE